MTLILDALYGLGIINIIENKKHIQFVCRGKQRTKVAEQVKEIPVEEYVEVVLTSPKVYQPTTDRAREESESEKGCAERASENRREDGGHH